MIYVNGKLVPKEEASISVFDHGFLYGDGVFEGQRHEEAIGRATEMGRSCLFVPGIMDINDIPVGQLTGSRTVPAVWDPIDEPSWFAREDWCSGRTSHDAGLVPLVSGFGLYGQLLARLASAGRCEPACVLCRRFGR